MKKLLVLLLILSTLPVAFAGPDVEVTLQRYEPFPAEPGTYTDVYLLISNKRGLAVDLAIEFVPEYPFSLSPGDDPKHFIGNLDALQENYAVVKYRVNIAPDAINKDYNFTILHNLGDQRTKIKSEFPLTVKGADASITLDGYDFTPKEIKPGETALLKLHLKNTGSGNVKDIDVSLDFSDTKVSTIGSGTTKRIPRLKPGERAEIDFEIIVDGSATVRVVDIPVKLAFKDYLNSKYEQTTNLGMIIKAAPELKVRLDDTDIIEQQTPGEISIQVINSGIVDLRYLTIELEKSPNYDILSYANDVYIGNLDSDDFEIANFKIHPKKRNPNLKFRVDFKDPYNTDYSQDYEIPLRVITPAQLGEKKSYTSSILIVLAIVCVGLYFYNRSRKRKKQLQDKRKKRK